MNRPFPRPPAAGFRPAALLLTALLLAAPCLPAAAGRPDAPDKYAGTYRIADWRALEGQGMAHFFYLHPDGTFLLAAAWPDHETSRFAGTWSVSEDRLFLNGRGDVQTNQGRWRTEYHRTFRIRVAEAGFALAPEPAKNRYGLLGWPNAFRYYRRQPSPNLPGIALPADAEAMGRLIGELLAARD